MISYLHILYMDLSLSIVALKLIKKALLELDVTHSRRRIVILATCECRIVKIQLCPFLHIPGTYLLARLISDNLKLLSIGNSFVSIYI